FMEPAYGTIETLSCDRAGCRRRSDAAGDALPVAGGERDRRHRVRKRGGCQIGTGAGGRQPGSADDRRQSCRSHERCGARACRHEIQSRARRHRHLGHAAAAGAAGRRAILAQALVAARRPPRGGADVAGLEPGRRGLVRGAGRFGGAPSALRRAMIWAADPAFAPSGALPMTLSFLLTSLIVVISPGTGVLYTLAVALTQGAKASVAAAL